MNEVESRTLQSINKQKQFLMRKTTEVVLDEKNLKQINHYLAKPIKIEGIYLYSINNGKQIKITIAEEIKNTS